MVGGSESFGGQSSLSDFGSHGFASGAPVPHLTHQWGRFRRFSHWQREAFNANTRFWKANLSFGKSPLTGHLRFGHEATHLDLIVHSQQPLSLHACAFRLG